MRIVDAHHHVWQPDAQADAPWHGYPWMIGPAAALRREFNTAHLRAELASAGVSATVLVQTQASLDETRAFLGIASQTDFIAGVIGWADLTDPALGETLADLRALPGGDALVGIRHQVHDEADAGWLSRPDVRRGLATVAAHGLAYDLLVRPRELPAALEAVRANPGLRFVIDHVGKPEIASGGFEPWAGRMRGFGDERAHVWCKLSGMVTEAAHDAWRPEHLRPYIRHALAVFGPDRCLFGSDWPVCTLAASYGEVLAALRRNLDGLDAGEEARVLAGNAIALYGLPVGDEDGAPLPAAH